MNMYHLQMVAEFGL